jgi:hypothetical protein
MFRSGFFTSLTVSIAILGGLSSAFATSFMPRPLDDAIQDTPVIVRGKIGNQYTDWVRGPGDGKSIQTFFQLNIDEVFKGAVEGTSLVFRQMGGEKDGVGLSVPGSADFQQGEDVVVLLSNPNPDGSYDLMGLSTGKYEVERNSDGKEILVGAGTQDPPQQPGLKPVREDVQHWGHGEDGEHLGTADQSKWSIENLRQIARAPKSSAPIKPKPSHLPTPSASAAPSERAPQLQPGVSETPDSRGENSLSRNLGVGIVLILGALIAFFLRGRR